MRILVVLFTLLLWVEYTKAGHFGKLVNNALAVHKKRKAGEAAEIGNIAHNKARKIKVAPAKPNNTKKDLKDETGDAVDAESEKSSVDSDESIAKKQSAFNNGQQMATSILTMILSRMIFKLDYKNKQIVLLCRIAFCAYIILSQLLFWFLKYQVNARDDQTILVKSSANPMAGLMNLAGTKLAASGPQGGLMGTLLALSGAKAGANGGVSPTMTVKQHDLEEIRKLSSSMLFELLAASYMHFVNKNYAPLLMIPLMGLTNKFKAPIVQLHVLRMRAVGPLARPFKSPMEAMLASVTGAAAAASDLRAEGAQEGTDSNQATEAPLLVPAPTGKSAVEPTVDTVTDTTPEDSSPASVAGSKTQSKSKGHKHKSAKHEVTHRVDKKKGKAAQPLPAGAESADNSIGDNSIGDSKGDSIGDGNVNIAELVVGDDMGDLLSEIDKLGE